jgi:hypothetical protein
MRQCGSQSAERSFTRVRAAGVWTRNNSTRSTSLLRCRWRRLRRCGGRVKVRMKPHTGRSLLPTQMLRLKLRLRLWSVATRDSPPLYSEGGSGMRKRDSLIRIVSDDDVEVPDGHTVRVRMNMMDSLAGHRQGYVQLTGEQVRMRRESRDAYVRDLTSAWRGPQARDANPPQFTCPECHGTGEDPDHDSPDGRCDYCGGVGYVRAPNNSSSRLGDPVLPERAPDTRLRVEARRKRRDDDEEPDTRRSREATADARRAAYETYCANLRDAWRRPAVGGGEPDAAEKLLGGPALDPGDPRSTLRPTGLPGDMDVVPPAAKTPTMK